MIASEPPGGRQSRSLIRQLGISRTRFPRSHSPRPFDVGGPCTVAVASDVINVTDPGITERIPARLVPQSDELGQPAVEAAPTGVAADNRASPIGLTIRSSEGDAI